MMNDEEFKELVMICIDKLKDETIFELTKNDEQYQRTTEEEGKADRAYLDLYLEPEQREVCDHFIECRDKQWDEYSTFAYIAGLRDAYRAERLFFPKKKEGDEA